MKALKNNLYMIGLMWRACPMRVVCSILVYLFWRLQELAYSLLILRLIMNSIESGASFGRMVCMLVAVFAFSVATFVFQSWFDHSYKPRTDIVINEYLLSMMYRQAVKCDLACYENPKFYDKYTRANEEILTRGIAILENISNLLASVVSAAICVGVITAYEPIVLPIALVCALCAMVIDQKRSGFKYDGYKASTPYNRQTEYVKRVVFLQDYAKELRLGQMFFPLMVHFEYAAKKSEKIIGHYFGISSVLRVVREVFMSFGLYLAAQGIIIYKYITYQAYALSDVVTIINAAANLQNRVYSFGWHVSDFIENGLYSENIREFLIYEPKIVEDENGCIPNSDNNTLSLKNVSFTYEGKTEPTIKNISIDLPPKTKIALVGHNGAGKSTLVKLIMRLYDVTEGEILLDGKNIKDYRLSEYRKKFGTIFQDFKIFATTITENVLLTPPRNDADRRHAYDSVIKAGLSEKLNSLENGMETQLTKEFDENGALMSGGEFQKIAVARVFAKESSIAILDEPSSALDPISEYEMFNSMMDACADKTVIFISHRLSSAVMADRIYMLEGGEIIEEGSHEQLMEKGGRYAEMFAMQAEQYRKEAAEHE